jgi:hypothetical protein
VNSFADFDVFSGNPIYIQIHLLANPNESVTFMVNPFVTLERILNFLCCKVCFPIV